MKFLLDLLAAIFKRPAPAAAPVPATATLQARAQQPGLPTGIAGLDVRQGLRRVMGREPLYLELLGKFARTQDRVPAQIRSALQADDAALAKRLAHTLRGLAGNLGAAALQAQAAEVELAIGGGTRLPELEAGLVRLAGLLDPLVQALHTALPAPATGAGPADAAAPDCAAVMAVGEHLRELLEQADGDALHYFSEHRALLQATIGPACDDIAQAIDGYDFDTAARTLAAAMPPC